METNDPRQKEPRVSGGAVRAGRWARVKARRGFALLITLTMLAFLVLLLVGLASYTRVETAVAGNAQRQAQARENALLALNVAIGQLQKHAGLDTRVTARADALESVAAQKRFYTGVWNSEAGAAGATVEPIAWLASGAEDLSTFNVATAPTAPTATLVGSRTDGSNASQATTAQLIDIRAPGVPGVSGSTVIGRYAWWVGDQGVKAPVAAADSTSAINYAPFGATGATDLRDRLKFQIGLGANAATAAGAPVFEPRDANNASFFAGKRIFATNQLSFLRTPTNGALTVATIRQNFHAWSPNNHAVIADTVRGGLRQDLSMDPNLLGAAFANWANYSAYMEPTQGAVANGEGQTTSIVPTGAPVISPDYGADPMRRRYVMTSHFLGDGGAHQVGPILSYFLLTFNVRTVNNSQAANAPMEVRARWMMSLWNPYTSALVPENLRVEVRGLPTSVTVISEATTAPLTPPFSLQSAFGSPLRINLPWDSAAGAGGTLADDRQSWLPGRVYSWRSNEDTSQGATPPSDGYASEFYSQTLSQGGDGVIRPLNNVSVDGSERTALTVSGPGRIVVTVYAVRPDGDVRLGQFTSPQFLEDFTTNGQPASGSDYQFSYVFRLAEGVDNVAAPGAWLTTAGLDFRRRSPPSEIFVVGENGDNPGAYGTSYSTIRSPDRLLDRATDSLDASEDVPVFELPRAPLLSMGALQHLRIVGQRPFMIGNPWGVGETVNGIRLGELFDRFFFSGLVSGVTPTTNAIGEVVLPNPLMTPVRKPDGKRVSVADLQGLMAPPPVLDSDGNVVSTGNPSSRSSKYFLQGGAFNLNSTDPVAWAAVLRRVRFAQTEELAFLQTDPTTGTAGDIVAKVPRTIPDTTRPWEPAVGDAVFFRFPHTAQETYDTNASVDTSVLGTENFRVGARRLTAAQVTALAGRIAENVKLRIRSVDGPFRSLDEFLSPSALYIGTDTSGNLDSPRSALEAAIVDANVNVDENGAIPFSSQFLTQADIMTALAPTLFPRSDTFVIRTHGQALNPVTGAVEGRAWCEATVQRLPEYIDATVDDAEVIQANLSSELNKVLGRRFKVVAFRWLTLSDI